MKKPKPLNEGDQIPDFSTTDEQGAVVSASGLRGNSFLLYFYPRDNTPGYTVEACGFRDLWSDFKGKKTKVFGVSGDSIKSHLKFREKFELPFPLLMDEDHSLANDLIRAKALRPEDLDAFPYKNVIVRALGLQAQVQVDSFYRSARPGQRPPSIGKRSQPDSSPTRSLRAPASRKRFPAHR